MEICLYYHWATKSLDFLIECADYIARSLLRENFLIVEDDAH